MRCLGATGIWFWCWFLVGELCFLVFCAWGVLRLVAAEWLIDSLGGFDGGCAGGGNVVDGRCSHCTGFWSWLGFGDERWSAPISRVDVMSSGRRHA